MQKITPFFWFDSEAGDAAKFYTSVFKNGKIKSTQYYPEAAEKVSGKKAGSVMTVEFEIEGMTFTALNGGKVPGFTLSPATSFVVTCDTQEEVDHLWENLSAVKEAEQCGWCTDKFGVTWQIVPKLLNELMSDKDPKKVEAVTKAFLQMKKFDMEKLQEAYDQA